MPRSTLVFCVSIKPVTKGGVPHNGIQNPLYYYILFLFTPVQSGTRENLNAS